MAELHVQDEDEGEKLHRFRVCLYNWISERGVTLSM